MRHRFAFVAIAAGLAANAPAQSTQFQQIFTSDSIIPLYAQTSPDGRWIVMVRTSGIRQGSLWIARAGSGTATRLTSDGYNDAQPAWFQSGDRIVFMSTRPNRNGGSQQYLMVQEIDPSTGRAVGAPRQVSNEPVQARARPSADGKWILYVTPGEPAQVKIIPVNGGNPRTLARGRHPIQALTFSPDGQYAYFTQQAGPGKDTCGSGTCQAYTLKRTSIADGFTTDVASAPHPIRAHPADPRYVQHRVAGRTSGTIIWELRDLTGRALGRIEFPDGVRQASFSGDGWGLVGINEQADRAIRIVPVNGGPLRTVTTGDQRWPEAWMADGSAVITDRVENGRVVIEVTALDGKPVRQFTLPANAQRTGWGTSVGPWFTYLTGPTGLSALNVVTGEMKQISSTASGTFSGRGGMAQDGSRFVYPESEGTQTSVKSTDPGTGATTTIRSFTNGAAQRRHMIAHGSRLAWIEARGDTIDLMVSDGANGAPRRISSARGRIESADESIAWSWKGDRLASCGRAAGDDTALTIFTIPASADARVTREVFPVGNDVGCWAPRWLPDESGMVFLTIMNRRVEDVPDLAYMALQPGARAQSLTAGEPGEIWNFDVSPDGKFAAFPVYLPVSRASIHIASFKPLVDGRR